MAVKADIRFADGDHVVHFYEREEDLVELVGGYLVASMLDGDAVIMIGVPEHQKAFRAALVAAGVDIDAAQASGRLIVADAVDLLSQFMADGSFDERAFDEIVGGLVRRAASPARPLRVYGEMVAVLWEAGNVAGAIELETLWNALGARVPFSLFCTYPVQISSGAHGTEAFGEVCQLHSDVIDGAPALGGAELTRRFTGSRHGPRFARAFVGDALRHWGLVHLVDDAVAVVSELAANAVVHAGSDFTVGLSRRDGAVHVEVADSSSEAPRSRDPGLSGNGLPLVAAIADRWGHNLVAGGKVVWANLRLPALEG